LKANEKYNMVVMKAILILTSTDNNEETDENSNVDNSNEN
jgi:hypothetical protein